MSLHVICLCAQWCGTCREYLPVFSQLEQQRPAFQWRWLDIEDKEHEDALDERDITTFPLILIVDDQRGLCFAGPVTPHGPALLRLCDTAAEGGLRATDGEIQAWCLLLKSLGLNPALQ